MAERLRWGILSTGNIANQFAEGVAGSQRSTVVAVGSRAAESADAFAKKHAIPTAHASYEALIDDPSVEAIYLALPNLYHRQWTLRAIAAGKHVLCEKPFAMNADEAQEMLDAAQRAGVVVIEAFMYRTHPLMGAVRAVLDSGDIGELRLIRTSFSYFTTKVQGNVRFDRALGGGGLMDVGCYCLSLARWAAGAEPIDATATARLHERGVDELCAGTLRFPGDIIASFTCGMAAQTDNTAYLCGTKGYIEIPIPWKPPQSSARYIVNRMTPPRQDGGRPTHRPREEYTVDAPCPLYGMQADAFAACVQDGAAPFVTASDTLGNMRLLDRLRAQIGMTW